MSLPSSTRVLVYGGRGALGSACVDAFKSKGWWTLSIDIAANLNADSSIIVQTHADLVEQAKQISDEVAKTLSNEKLDAVFCVAGGWAGGNASSGDFVKNCDMVLKQSVWTSIIASEIAAHHLKPGGILQLTGAKPALEATPGMIGYGMAKAAVHQMTKSLAAPKGSGLPDGAASVCILPITLDTPMNRKFMPNADYSKWTPLEFVAKTFIDWVANPVDRPLNGSLIQLITEAGETKLVPVD